MLPIPCIKEVAGTFELLELEHVLVGAREIDGLRHAVGPLHAQHIGLEVAAESKGCRRSGDDARLVQLAGAYLEPRADSERVVLAAARAEGGQLHLHREMRVASVVAKQVHAATPAEHDVRISVAIDVRNQERSNRIVLHRWRQQRTAIDERSVAVVAIQHRAAWSRDDQVEPAVVVVVQESGGGAAGESLALCQLACPVVVPENPAGPGGEAPRDKDVERAVVVVITHHGGAGSGTYAGAGIREALRAISTEQGIAAILAGHEDVDMSVVIEVAKRGVTAAAPKPQ